MKADSITPGWFSIAGAAAYTGLSESSIRKAIDLAHFPARRVAVAEGSNLPLVRIARADLDAWIASQPLANPKTA